MYKVGKLNKISPVGLNLLTDAYEVTEKIEEAEAILVRSADMHEMDFSENLLAIARAGVGVNNIPLDRCADEGIVVMNTPGANANGVKELVISGMLLAYRNLVDASNWAAALEEGEVSIEKQVEKGKSMFKGNEITGKKLGIIGLGGIGVMIANAAMDLGMDVIGYDPYFSTKSALSLNGDIEIAKEMMDVVPDADFVIAQVHSTPATKGLISREVIEAMKEGSVLLNFARAPIVDEEAVKEALAAGKLRKYVTDFPNKGIKGVENIIVLPHLGASTDEAEDNCAKMAVKQIMEYVENGNVINAANIPSVSLGKKNGTRVAVLSKANDSIVADITSAIGSIKKIESKSNDKYAYTLVETDKNIDAVEIANDAVIKVRVIK